MNIAILGSTGSIGTQTLEVVRAHSDLFNVELLTAMNNWELLATQAVEFNVSAVVIVNPVHYDALRLRLSGHPEIKIYCGADAMAQEVCNSYIDTVVTALVGFAGLAPTVAAIKAGKRIALANKETLVVAGELIMPLAREHRVSILPVDSEHSAILQCIVGEPSPLKRIIITASGGALRDVPISELSAVTAAQALRHPCWAMGAKITIDSATMVNKGFEVMEAAHLFGLHSSQIDVTIHPQSIVHSFVEFQDGALKAQMGLPDMRLPIQYALTFPQRMPLTGGASTAGGGGYNPWEHAALSFSEADPLRYPCLELAFEAMRIGGTAPCIFNAANEVAVAAFLKNQIGYSQIYDTLHYTLNRVVHAGLTDIEQLEGVDIEARLSAGAFLGV